MGLGLIGGSLGMALRRRRLAREVAGLSRHAATIRRAAARGAIDRGTTDAADAVRSAEVVVLATPVDTIPAYARRLARFMRPGSVLTDVGSTKAAIVRQAERSLPPSVAFVGAHPLAGSEQGGIAAAREDLFDTSVCILTPTTRTDRRALARVTRLWAPLVGRIVVMSPDEHDRLLAATSHLPHLVSTALVLSAGPAARRHAAPSFREMTRVAQSDPGLWDDIIFTNRANLLKAMGRFSAQWRALRRAVAGARRAELCRLLIRARSLRHAIDR